MGIATGALVGVGTAVGTAGLVGVGMAIGTAVLVGIGADAGAGVVSGGAGVGVGVGLTTATASLPLLGGGTNTGNWLPFPDPAAATATRVPTAAKSATPPTAASIRDLLRFLLLADWSGVPITVAPAGKIIPTTGCRPAAWGTVSCRVANAWASSPAD